MLLADALKGIKNNTLISVDLERNDIGDVGAAKIAEALLNNNTLTSINLNCNNISDAGVIKIAEALLTNNTLTLISLRGNNIGDAGATKIAKVLGVNNTLTSISLRSNNIGDVGVAKITKALLTNSTLASINFKDNNIGDVGAAKIAEALLTNNTLTSVDLEYNDIDVNHCKTINEHLRNNQKLVQERNIVHKDQNKFTVINQGDSIQNIWVKTTISQEKIAELRSALIKQGASLIKIEEMFSVYISLEERLNRLLQLDEFAQDEPLRTFFLAIRNRLAAITSHYACSGVAESIERFAELSGMSIFPWLFSMQRKKQIQYAHRIMQYSSIGILDFSNQQIAYELTYYLQDKLRYCQTEGIFRIAYAFLDKISVMITKQVIQHRNKARKHDTALNEVAKLISEVCHDVLSRERISDKFKIHTLKKSRVATLFDKLNKRKQKEINFSKWTLESTLTQGGYAYADESTVVFCDVLMRKQLKNINSEVYDTPFKRAKFCRPEKYGYFYFHTKARAEDFLARQCEKINAKIKNKSHVIEMELNATDEKLGPPNLFSSAEALEEKPYELEKDPELTETRHNDFMPNVNNEDNNSGDYALYTDEDINTLLTYYVSDNQNIELLTAMLGTNWRGRNELQENLIEFNRQRCQQIESGQAPRNKVLIPVNLNNNHWALLYIVYQQDTDKLPVINYYDPLGHEIPSDISKALSNKENFSTIELINIGQRVQNDSYNCGLWLIEAVKGIVKNGSIPKDDYDIVRARREHNSILVKAGYPRYSTQRQHSLENKLNVGSTAFEQLRVIGKKTTKNEERIVALQCQLKDEKTRGMEARENVERLKVELEEERAERMNLKKSIKLMKEQMNQLMEKSQSQRVGDAIGISTSSTAPTFFPAPSSTSHSSKKEAQTYIYDSSKSPGNLKKPNYRYQIDDIMYLLKYSLTLDNVLIKKPVFPFLQNYKKNQANKLQLYIEENIRNNNPFVLLVNTLEEGHLTLKSTIETLNLIDSNNNHWIGLIVKPNENDTYLPEIKWLDSCGNNTGKLYDIDIIFPKEGDTQTDKEAIDFWKKENKLANCFLFYKDCKGWCYLGNKSNGEKLSGYADKDMLSITQDFNCNEFFKQKTDILKKLAEKHGLQLSRNIVIDASQDLKAEAEKYVYMKKKYVLPLLKLIRSIETEQKYIQPKIIISRYTQNNSRPDYGPFLVENILSSLSHQIPASKEKYIRSEHQYICKHVTYAKKKKKNKKEKFYQEKINKLVFEHREKWKEMDFEMRKKFKEEDEIRYRLLTEYDKLFLELSPRP